MTTTAAVETEPAVKVRKPHGKRRQKLTESDAVLQSVMQRRLRKAVVVTGVKLATGITIISPTQLDDLQVDEAYQRVRITDEVNELIQVIRSGGEIPDPIDVSQRPDGSRYIVDGQQRFWAHYETKSPLRAQIHLVDSIEAEVNLFVVLNSRRRLSPRAILKGWPGLSGKFIRNLNTSEKSPMRGMIDLNNNTKLPLDSITVAKGVLVALTGIVPNGDTATRMLPRLDSALSVPGRTVWAEAFAQLTAAVFGGKTGQGRVRILPVVALGRVAYRKYSAAGRPVFPSTCTRLRATNWDTLVPSHAHKYLGLIEEKIERLWK